MFMSDVICSSVFDHLSRCFRAKNETPTNILKLFCALKSQGSDLVPQIAMYDPGLGTVDDLADNWWGTCTKILQRCFGGAFGAF